MAACLKTTTMKAKAIAIFGLSALIMSSCAINSPTRRMKKLAKENLEASLDYPKQLKVMAMADPDSAFGANYFSKQEIKGMLRVMSVVTKQLMDKTNGMSDFSKLDPYYNALIQRQMSAASEVQNMIFKNVQKGEWSGWKVKIDYECADKNGIKYRAERWVFFDRKGNNVVKSFEIPLP